MTKHILNLAFPGGRFSAASHDEFLVCRPKTILESTLAPGYAEPTAANQSRPPFPDGAMMTSMPLFHQALLHCTSFRSTL